MTRVIIEIPNKRATRDKSATALFYSKLDQLSDSKEVDSIHPNAVFGFPKIEDGLEIWSDSRDIQPGPSSLLVEANVSAEDADSLPQEISGCRLYSNPPIALHGPCFGDPAECDHMEILSRLNITELWDDGFDGAEIAIAFVDTGINQNHLNQSLGEYTTIDKVNSWVPPGSSSLPGSFPIDHGTMSAFSGLLTAPASTIVDCAVFSSPTPTAPIGQSYLYSVLPALTFIWQRWLQPGDSTLRKYKGLVCSNSWGIPAPSYDFPPGHPGRFIDNPQHPVQQFIETIAFSGIDLVFSSGNCGFSCPDQICGGYTQQNISGLNASRAVLTVSGCSPSGEIAGYSSQGPAIAGMYHQKPDISAFTHFLGSEVYGQGVPDQGTSVAAPLVAGIIALIRSRFSHKSISVLELQEIFRLTAMSQSASEGWAPDHGYGIVDPSSLAHYFRGIE